MKWLTAPALLAAALFSAVVVIPFLPAAKNNHDIFAFEATVASSAAGRIQIYYDIGRGYIEADGTDQPLAKTDTPQVYRLILPAGQYRSIRFDPIDGPGRVVIAEPPRIISESGRVIRTVAFSELEPLQQIASALVANGGFEVVTDRGANDPQLRITFSPPLVIAPTWRERVVGFLPRSLGVFAAFALLLFALDRASAARTKFSAFARSLALRPTRAIAIV